MVEILGLAWLGTRTTEFEAMARFFRDALGLAPVHEEAGFFAFRLPDGATIELFGPRSSFHRHFDTGPVAGFRVADVDTARAELEALGVVFVHQGGSDDNSVAWAHFRAPDGTLFEITHRRDPTLPGHPDLVALEPRGERPCAHGLRGGTLPPPGHGGGRHDEHEH